MAGSFILLVLFLPLFIFAENDPTPIPYNAQLFTYRSPAPDVVDAGGAFEERISLQIPPGRNGLNPELALVYNNQALNDDSIVGYGWTLPIPSIERLNKTGSENLYTDSYFRSSLGGELATTTTANEYRHRIEDGRFITYTYANDIWTAYDKAGRRYKFGHTSGTQQATTSPTRIYKWMLEEIRDPNDNYIKYEYTKDQGQIYISKITYTGNGVTDGIFEIDFTYETRPDPTTSYKTNFKVVTGKRLTQVQASVNDSWVRKYALSYTSGVNGARSLLSAIQETGRDDQLNELSLPAVTFGYSSSTVSYVSHTNAHIANAADSVADVDGNGLPDYARFYQNSATLQTYRYIGDNEYPDFNYGNTNVSTEYWATENAPIERGVRFFDVNGDGLADIIRGRKLRDANGEYSYSNSYAVNTGPCS